MYFDPFRKPIESLEASDLESLRDVAEGWYVEYKRSSIGAKNTAKSLAGFANHFGGWLVFGIDAPTRTPKSFPGLEPGDVAIVSDNLRDALRHHVNPEVVFQLRELKGPCIPLGLAANRSIVLVEIQQGRNPPYVHSSGRIYRRLADSSEPKPETDRAVIDELVRRANEYREQFRRRLELRPELSESESEQPVLQLFLTSDPWNQRVLSRLIRHDEFSEVMRRVDDAAYSISLDCSFPNALGFTARHVVKNDPYNLLYTWEFSHRGFSTVVIPLRLIDQGAIKVYKHATDFLRALPDSLRSSVLDANTLWPFLTSIMAKHNELSRRIGIGGPVFLKGRFLNVWRKTAFIDSEAYVEHVARHGVPVIQQSELLAPPGYDPDSMLRIEPVVDGIDDPKFNSMAEAGGALSILLGPLGVPVDVLLSSKEPGGFVDVLTRTIRVVAEPAAWG